MIYSTNIFSTMLVPNEALIVILYHFLNYFNKFIFHSYWHWNIAHDNKKWFAQLTFFSINSFCANKNKVVSDIYIGIIECTLLSCTQKLLYRFTQKLLILKIM